MTMVKAAPESPSTCLGNIVISPRDYRVAVNGELIELSLSEFNVLKTMAAYPNGILPYNLLAQAAWRQAEKRQLRTLNVLIHRLRAKLENSFPYTIETVRGRGYGLLLDPGARQSAS